MKTNMNKKITKRHGAAAVKNTTLDKKPTGKTTAAKKTPTLQPCGADAKMTGLDAAAKVLAEAAMPLPCKDMVDRMLAGKLWTTSGKTPANTIYAAILREINVKGDKSRFRKAGRGMFEIAKIH